MENDKIVHKRKIQINEKNADSIERRPKTEHEESVSAAVHTITNPLQSSLCVLLATLRLRVVRGGVS